LGDAERTFPVEKKAEARGTGKDRTLFFVPGIGNSIQKEHRSGEGGNVGAMNGGKKEKRTPVGEREERKKGDPTACTEKGERKRGDRLTVMKGRWQRGNDRKIVSVFRHMSTVEKPRIALLNS